MSLVINEIGKTYSKLYVVERAQNTDSGNAMWRCACECGEEIITTGTRLRRGDSRSCGCMRYLPDGEASFRALFRSYRDKAGTRGFEWGLTPEEFRNLTSATCNWCGIEPQQLIGHTYGYRGTYIYNGIDRLDNTIGYITKNCVACCGQCNKAKHVHSVQDFKKWLERAFNHTIGKYNGV